MADRELADQMKPNLTTETYHFQHSQKLGVVFNVQRFSIHDGPGIRTTVFLKGCPLHCCWCANPESISTKPELGVIRNRCDKCMKCLEACPEAAIVFTEDKDVHIDRSRCTACGKCVEVCYPEALAIYGKEMSVEEVFERVRRDEIFYRGSGGGLTVSGGEPLEQFEFVIALFKMCREAGIHTCLDTSGYVGSDVLSKVLALTDYVLYDIKHMDSGVHSQFTGMPNDLVLANAKVVAESGIPMLIRIPVIPGVNDTLENIRETAHFVEMLRENIAIELLPYHRMGLGKYQALDTPYPLEGTQPLEPASLELIRQTIEGVGVKCILSR